MFTIDYLKNRPDCIPELARIWHEVLGKIWAPDVPVSRTDENLRRHLNTDTLPLTFVALHQDQPIGMCSLRVSDGILPEFTPWLGSLVVSAAHQKQGVAQSLIDTVKEKARGMDFKSLYLFAFDPTLPQYYSRLGWTTIGMNTCKGHPVTVMEIML